MDKTTTWIISIMSIVVSAAIGGGIYFLSKNNKIERKLDAESDSVNNP